VSEKVSQILLCLKRIRGMPVRKDLGALRASMARALESKDNSSTGKTLDSSPGKTLDSSPGKTLFAAGKYKEACVEFKKTLKTENCKNDVSTHSNLALCYLKLKQYKAALDQTTEALKLDFSDHENVRRKIVFRRALAKEGLSIDEEQDIEDLRSIASAFQAEGKTAEAEALREVFHRLMSSQRLRNLKAAARAEGWCIDEDDEDDPRPEITSKINEKSDYFSASTPGHDREIKTIRSSDESKPVEMPPGVEERLRNSRQEEEFQLNGPQEGVRPMGEPVPKWVVKSETDGQGEWEEDFSDLEGEEKKYEPYLKLYGDFMDRTRWKQELMSRCAKYRT